MKKILIAGVFALFTFGVSAQTGGQKKKTKVKSETTTSDTTSVKTRGMDKGSEQGRTTKAKHRSSKSGGTKHTGHNNHTDTTQQ